VRRIVSRFSDRGKAVSHRLGFCVLLGLSLVLGACHGTAYDVLDVLLLGGRIVDGSGTPWVYRDVGIAGDRIVFVGHARGLSARDTVDVSGLLVTPGFWDMHSHADYSVEHGRQGLPMLYQGITTVVLGIDGGGTNEVAATFAGYRDQGIATNVLQYVGHNAARGLVMGVADRDPTPDEMEAMKSYVRRGMEEGALGLSTGLFYNPGYFASTEEVIELNRVAAEYDGIYDTHDRDLGATYHGVGYLESIREAIEIGERAGTPVIFSHFNAQGRLNRGRAWEGARLIDSARARGIDVMAAQHVYTATQSSLTAYAVPRWVAVGDHESMVRRFNHPDTVKLLDVATMEMLDIRGGAEKLLFTDERSDLNGKTLADVAREWDMPLPEVVRRILREGNAGVMNLELYDIVNTKFLAQQEWMMTCTDGGTPVFGQGITHPRSYGAFTRKLSEFVRRDSVISLAFAVRGMTATAAMFLGIPDRGLVKEGFFADVAVFDEHEIRDNATFEDPHQYSSGTVHVIVNGEFALRDGEPTGILNGQPIPRGG
jgi:N-acyl-D-amino-acid deacylase